MTMGLPLLGSPLMYSLAHIPLGRGGALDSSYMSGDVVENKVDLMKMVRVATMQFRRT